MQELFCDFIHFFNFALLFSYPERSGCGTDDFSKMMFHKKFMPLFAPNAWFSAISQKSRVQLSSNDFAAHNNDSNVPQADANVKPFLRLVQVWVCVVK
jgi:hypothetical protein